MNLKSWCHNGPFSRDQKSETEHFEAKCLFLPSNSTLAKYDDEPYMPLVYKSFLKLDQNFRKRWVRK